jgi:hypothetical protein
MSVVNRKGVQSLAGDHSGKQMELGVPVQSGHGFLFFH